MAMDDDVEVPLRLFVADDAAGTDRVAHVPGGSSPGVPLDPARVAAWEHDRDAPDDTTIASLRAGDSGQTFAGVADGGQQADPSGYFDSGSGGGDGGGE
ncbi:hypothetical protein [Arthrobacter sp. NPDC092385]|uniref:hypothetical protein n=1 Tax=Arthrobacter sp. NPDC092385 TaxID=3363943 RepID=UPI0037F133B8